MHPMAQRGDTVTVDGVQYVAHDDSGDLWHRADESKKTAGTAYDVQELPGIRKELSRLRRDLRDAERDPEGWGGDDPAELRLSIQDGESEVAILEKLKKSNPSSSWFGDRS